MLFLFHGSILNFKQSNLSWVSQSLTLGYCKRNLNGISYSDNGNKIISNFIITCEERMATTHVRLELGRLFVTNPCAFFLDCVNSTMEHDFHKANLQFYHKILCKVKVVVNIAHFIDEIKLLNFI